MDFNQLNWNRRELQVALNQFDPSFLQTLSTLQDLGVMSDAQIRDFCVENLSCQIVASLPISSSHPNLLMGLEPFLSQGVVSQEQILQWCQTYLSDPLPAIEPSLEMATQERRQALNQLPNQSPNQPVSKVGWVPSLVQSLMDEMSVLWLLFVGVFLVVVSSAVLAASQWNSVSAVGQYGILWTYTVAFWGVSHWLGRRENLQLTAQTLQLTTLLIIPVNFWMIDSFRLIQGGMSLAGAVLAGVLLSGLMAYTLMPRTRRANDASHRGWGVGLTVLLLSWLHWGWSADWFPPVAIYVGIVVTGVAIVWGRSEVLDTVRPRPPNRYSFQRLLALTPLYGMLLLLLRGVWIEQLPWSSLGLAFGLVGAIFCWTGRRPRSGAKEADAVKPDGLNSGASNSGAQAWWVLGCVALVLGRLLAVEVSWQAVCVTLLGLGLFIDRLLLCWQPWLVGLIFLTGLQGLYPLYSLVPATVQSSVLNGVTSFAGEKGVQSALVSVLVLPYWWGTVWAIGFFERRRSQLVRLAQGLSLGLGGVLTLLTLENSGLRVIFLLGVAVPLGQRPQPSPLRVGLLHCVVLGAIASGMDALFPTFSEVQWTMLTLGGMVVEFALSAVGPVKWRQSAWWIALFLATAGYLCLLLRSPYMNSAVEPLEPTMMGWLLPISLIGVGYVRSFPWRSSAQGLGLATVFAAQWLCLPHAPLRLVGFGLALVATGALSRVMRRFFPVAVTVGWGVALAMDGWITYLPTDVDDWLGVFLAGLSLLLTGGAGVMHRSRAGLAILYRRALMGWAYGGMVIVTGVLCGVVLSVFSDAEMVLLPMPIGAVITAISALYQFKLRPSPGRFYLSAIAVEVSILLSAWLSPWPREMMAMGTLGVGLVSLLCAPDSPRIARRHWTILPLMLAGFGCFLGHTEFVADTGGWTIGASLLLLLLGRRGQRGMTYLGMAGLSFGLYELLVYQMLQAGGDHPGDALVIFAGVATGLAIADRVFTRGLTRILRLSSTQFLPVAHFHWLAASLFLLTALVAPMQGWAEVAWIGLMGMLTVYAMVAGRIQSDFLYVGVAQGLGAIAFGLAQVVPMFVLGHWSGAIAVGLAALLYYFPWSRYGLAVIPGQRMAMILPVSLIVVSWPIVGLTSLLCAGAWYFWISQRPNLLRLSYVGLVFGNWAILLLLERWGTVTFMGLTMMAGCSFLLMIQWEPLLQTPDRREVRHWLQCFALGLIALVALYESEGDLVGSLGVVLAGLLVGGVGLMLRVRSFLYVGTGLFLVKVLWMLWVFVSDYSFLLWALGIVLGIGLIWVAATFESRRTQAIALLEYWTDALQRWQ